MKPTKQMNKLLSDCASEDKHTSEVAMHKFADVMSECLMVEAGKRADCEINYIPVLHSVSDFTEYGINVVERFNNLQIDKKHFADERWDVVGHGLEKFAEEFIEIISSEKECYNIKVVPIIDLKKLGLKAIYFVPQ